MYSLVENEADNYQGKTEIVSTKQKDQNRDEVNTHARHQELLLTEIEASLTSRHSVVCNLSGNR